jgi:hypothetical protein
MMWRLSASMAAGFEIDRFSKVRGPMANFYAKLVPTASLLCRFQPGCFLKKWRGKPAEILTERFGLS